MESYTITLISRKKEVLFKETVKATCKVEAWGMVEVRLFKAMRNKGEGRYKGDMLG